ANLVLALAAKGAVEGVLRVAGWLGHCISVGQPRRVAIMLGQASKPAQPISGAAGPVPRGLDRAWIAGVGARIGLILSAPGLASRSRGSAASPPPRRSGRSSWPARDP